MSHGCRHLNAWVWLILAASAAACSGGEELVGPTTGTLEITSSTVGADPDEDGYTAQIDQGAAIALGPNAAIGISEVVAGTHSVLLAGLAPNCTTLGANPRIVTVNAGQLTTVAYEITCTASSGQLRVSSSTSGSSPDPDGYAVTLDGMDRGPLATNGEILLDEVAPGAHMVGVAGLSGNCQVEGENPRVITVTAGATAEAAFAILCQALPPSTGTLQVNTVTSGPGTDPDGYAFTIGGGGTQPIGAKARVTVPEVGAGVQAVELSGIAGHCSLDGDNPRSVTVPSGGTVAVTFSLSCGATTGNIEISTSTSGPNSDTDGYAIEIDGVPHGSVAANATVTVPDLPAGHHNVRISGLAGNCSVQGANPQGVTVTAGSTTDVAFVIVCSAGSIMITTNPPVSALSGEVFDPQAQPVVVVKDGSGNAAVGASVTARIVSGNGALEGSTTVNSNGIGVAAFGDLGIRGTGGQTLEFTSGAAAVTSSPVTLSPLPAAATTGSWGPVVRWDIVPLHMSLLPNGKIFAWGKTDVADTMGMPRIWDPSTGAPPTSAAEIHVKEMLFCAGHSLLPDGNLMVAGGHHRDDAGIKVTYFFSQEGVPQRKPDMAHGRWYPTLTVLANGNVLSMAGRNEAGSVVRTPELWNGSGWSQLTGAGTLEIPYYPRNFVDPKDGRVFYAGERVMSRWFNVDATGVGGGRGSWTTGPTHLYGFNRDYGSAVMYDAGKILVVGGGGHTSWPTPDPRSATPTATAEWIDLNQTSPRWQSAGSMSAPRRHLNSTILPDGQVLVTGGTRGGGFVNISEGLAVKQAELWNPNNNAWATLAANQVMRIYHSVSLLLPNGTVLHGASGDAMAGTVPVPAERSHEIFSPPYLFKGVRPSITSAPASVGYGQTFSVATPNAAQITQARWIRLGSVTHAFDMSQRANTLSFNRAATGIEVTAPANPNLAPPGHYLLFILNRNGVPSAGRVVRVQ